MQDKVLVIACGAIARELVQIRNLNRWDHLVIKCLPPELHNRPERIPPAVKARIDALAGNYRKTFVAYADCGTGGALDRVLKDKGIERIPGAHCYEFLTGAARFTELADSGPGSFYLTDFLTRHFERLVMHSLGIDRLPHLKESYFKHYQRLVYLAQSNSAALQTMAKKHADTLGLAYEYHHCGIAPLTRVLKPTLVSCKRPSLGTYQR